MPRKDLPQSQQVSPTDAPHALSRRSFLRLAVGSLTALPAVAGGVLVGAPAMVYAEEDADGEADLLAQATDSTSKPITIVATKIDQVCVSVINIGGGRRSAVTIPGAKVKLKSYATEKTVEGTTNDKGVVVLSIADLAEPEPKAKGEYTFRAFVEMSAPGYRIFRSGLSIVKGGKGLEIATEKIEPGVPYPSRASFDDWDVLYTNNDWVLYEKNDYSHDLVVELEGLKTSPLTVKFADNDGHIFTQGTVTPKGEHATITFTGKYLEAKKKYALPVGGSFLIQFSQDGVDYEFPIALVVKPFTGNEDQDPKVNDLIYKIAPLASVNKLLEFTVPPHIAVIGNTKIRLLPDFVFPIMVTTDFVSGYYAVSINLNTFFSGKLPAGPNPDQEKDKRFANFFGFKTKNGKPDKNAWKTHPAKTTWEQIKDGAKDAYQLYDGFLDKKKERETKQFQDNENAKAKNLPEKNSCVTKMPGFFDKYFTVSTWLSFGAMWQREPKLWQVNGGHIAATVAFGGAFTKYWLIGWVPVFINISYGLEATAAITALSFTTPELFSLDKYKWDSRMNSQGFTITIVPAVTASAGVGIKGFVSLSLVFGLTLTIRLGWSLTTPSNENLPTPARNKNFRFVFGMSFKFSVLLQLFIASIEKSFPIWGDPRIYDSWRDKGSGVTAQEMNEAVSSELWAMNLLDALNDPDTIVTVIPEAALSELVEFEGSYDDSFLASQAIGEGAAGAEGVVTSDANAVEFEEVVDDEGELWWTIKLAHFNDDPLAEGSEDAAGDEDAELQQQADQQQAEQQADQQQVAERDGQQAEQQGEGAAAAAVATSEAADATEPAATSVASEASTSSATSAEVAEPNATSASAGAADSATAVVASESQPQDAAPLEAAALVAAATGEEPDPGIAGTPEASSDQLTEAAPTANSDQPAEAAPTASSDQPSEAAPTAEPNQQPQATNDPAVPHPDTYGDFVPTRSYLFEMNLSAQDGEHFKGIGRNGGLIPARDAVIAPDVMSDPRTKIVDIMDTPHVFRIAVVNVNGKPRTRVVCHQLDTSKPGIGARTFDIPVGKHEKGIRRDDLFDYDFDVYVEQVSDSLTGIKGLGGGYIHIFTVSGYRERGDDTPISSLATDQFLCYGLFAYVSTSSRFMAPFKFKLTDSMIVHGSDIAWGLVVDREYKYNMFSCPQIAPVFPDNRTPGSFNPMMVAFLDRVSDNKGDIFLTEKSLDAAEGGARVNMVVGFVSRSRIDKLVKLTFPSGSIIQRRIGTIDDPTIYGISLSEMIYGTNGYHLIQLHGKERVHSYAVQILSNGYDMATGRMSAVAYPSDESVNYEMAQLVPWRAGTFLATVNSEPSSDERQEELGGPNSRESTLYRVDIKDIDSKPTFVFKDAGLSGLGITSFCVDARGNTIYWPALNDKAQVFDADEEDGLRETDRTDSYYVIKASDFWSANGYIDEAEGTFSEPYVFAEVPHRMDTLTLPKRSATDYVRMDAYAAGEVSFISTEILDAKVGKANIWCTTVPVTRCLTVIEATAEHNVVLPGMSVDINVAVRNDGNEWIRCFDANVCKKDGTVLLQETVFFGPETLLTSRWNPLGADGKLENNKYDYWLAPGRSGLYRLSFPVPADWSGETEIVVRVANLSAKENANPMYVFGDDLGAMAEAVDPVEYNEILEDEPYDVLIVEEGGDYEVDAEDLSPAPVTAQGAQEETGAAPGAGGRSGEVLPRTGDDGGGQGLGALGLAAAALGAGMAAYSKRRTEIEAEED